MRKAILLTTFACVLGNAGSALALDNANFSAQNSGSILIAAGGAGAGGAGGGAGAGGAGAAGGGGMAGAASGAHAGVGEV